MLTSLGAYVTFMLTSPGPHVVMVWQDNELDLYAVPGHGSEQKEVTRTLTLAPNLTLALTHTHTLSLALNLALTLPLTLSQVRKVGVLKGHSSNVNHVDWDVTSRMLQSDCGAHELLNWMLYDDTPDGQGRWRPHQVPSPSSGPSPDPNPNPDPDSNPNPGPELTNVESELEGDPLSRLACRDRLPRETFRRLVRMVEEGSEPRLGQWRGAVHHTKLWDENRGGVVVDRLRAVAERCHQTAERVVGLDLLNVGGHDCIGDGQVEPIEMIDKRHDRHEGAAKGELGVQPANRRAGALTLPLAP